MSVSGIFAHIIILGLLHKKIVTKVKEEYINHNV